MRSTFHGLETARRGMFTQQTALQTTGNNIANANTPGYSRQRVNFSQTEPYPAAAMNRPNIPGQLGTGVEAGSIQRVREGFLDTQFRGENNKFGFWNAKSEALAKMEDIMNEPSDNGLAKTMDRFWQSLQDLSVNPEDSGARSVVRQRGLAVAETFNYLSNSLSAIQGDLKTQADLTTKEINAILKDIDSINKQISEVEPHGYLPNKLYDERDSLVDRLSTLVNVKVTPIKSGGQPSTIAEGQYQIELLSSNGNSYSPAVTLVDPNSTNSLGKVDITYDSTNTIVQNVVVTSASDAATAYNIDAENLSNGELKGLIESNGFVDSLGNVKGNYPEMLASLDEMAFEFATEFNKVQQDGWNLENINAGTKTPATTYSFFDGIGATSAGAAKGITLHANMEGTAGLDRIAAAWAPAEEVAYSGDGSNALKLADIKNAKIFSGNATLQSYYEGKIGQMAVDAQQAVRLTENSSVLAGAVDQRRISVSGVSLDEEMTNMIQFQHAYNASARNITVIDEMLDKIINGMGVGGR
jgi:flagellar hook-associated protein 1